jgi:hypothetical protein
MLGIQNLVILALWGAIPLVRAWPWMRGDCATRQTASITALISNALMASGIYQSQRLKLGVIRWLIYIEKVDDVGDVIDM